MGNATSTQQKIAKLEAEQEQLRKSLVSAEQARDKYRKLYLQMLETCKKLEQGLLGQKAERTGDDGQQLTMQLLEMLLGEEEAAQLRAEVDKAAEEQEVKGHQRRKPTGRKPLPEHLPRVEVEILPPEVQQEGLDAFERIGQEVTEVLEHRRASMVVVRVIKPKFVRKKPEAAEPESPTVLVGETPERPIPRGMAGPGLLADTIVKRWCDHLPLNRQEQIYLREEVELSRSTLCDWHLQLVPLVAPLIEAMHQDALKQPYLCTDATGVLVQAKGKCRNGHFWVLVVPKRHVLFKFSQKHDSQAVDRLLPGYQGYIVADAHTVYDHLYGEGKATESGCWSHARRYYFKTLTSEPELAKHAMGLINALFRIERTIANSPRKKREAVRREKSAPIVEKYFEWCDAEKSKVLEDTPIAKAIGYSRNQREALKQFLKDGRLPMHNNSSELALRREAIGRKNWLFVGSEDGAEANVTFVSLLASCQLHGIEPWAYLRDLLCLLPDWPVRRVLELAPVNWQQTLEQDHIQQRLASNPYRAATL